MPFQKFGLPSTLLRNVQALNYTAPTPVQDQAIPLIRTGRDLVATAQTGTGKTAAFLLPVMHQLLERPRGGTGALVLTPTRELAQQIEGCFRGLARGTALRGALVVGGVPEAPQVRSLRAGVDLVVATPGRLLALLRTGKHPMPALTTLILDEADQMFDLGFFPDVKRIIAQLPNRRQTLLFSATMPPDVARLGQSILQDPHKVAIGSQGTPATTVTQNVYPVPAQRKTALLEHLLEQLDKPSVLVFTRTKHGARRLARVLNEAGHDVAELHSDRSPAQRTRAMHGFRTQACPVMVATNIAARGLDVRHITHVINFDVPAAPEEYVHRIGRTGRAGDAGEAIVFMSPEEAPILARIERQLGKRLPRLHLNDFDYTVKHAPARASAGKLYGGKPTGARHRRETAMAVGNGPRKPSRGQGRR
jgi:ATP-dependent RNA helicase RhlE